LAESPLSSCRDFSTLSPASVSPSTPTSPLVHSPDDEPSSQMAFVEASQPIFSVDGPKNKICRTMFEGARKETFYLLSVNFYPLWLTQTQQKMAADGLGDVPIPKSLATVLANKYWLNSFEEFLKAQLAVENLKFYQEATRFLETDFSGNEMMELDAQRLFLRFIAPSSTEQINTSAEISHYLCRVLFHKELEVVMEEQRSQQEQRTAVLNDILKGSGSKKSSKASPIKTSESFGSDKELEQMSSSSSSSSTCIFEEEPATPRKRSGLLRRSLSHFSLHFRKTSDPDTVPVRLSSTNPHPSYKSVGGDSDAPAHGKEPLNSLRNVHSYSSTNLVQYQQLLRQEQAAAASSATAPTPKVHRTRSASMGLNLLAKEAKKNSSSRRNLDLSVSDSTPESVLSKSQTPPPVDPPTPIKHGHHHHSSSSLASRRHGSPLVTDVDVGSTTIDLNGKPHSPTSPLSGRKHHSPRHHSQSHLPSPQQPKRSGHHSTSTSTSTSSTTASTSSTTPGSTSNSTPASSHKAPPSSSSKSTTPVTNESDTPAPQTVALSPPVLPERLALQETPAVLSSPHKKHKHKSRTTPRGTATPSPRTDPTSVNPNPELTPRSSHAKSGRKARQKNHSKKGDDVQNKTDGSSFRRSGSTHSLDDNIPTQSSMLDGSRSSSFRYTDEDYDRHDRHSATASPSSNAPSHTFRKNSTATLGLRRGSYDAAEIRKPSLSFSSSEALSDALLSVDSITSGESTPKVSVTRFDPTS